MLGLDVSIIAIITVDVMQKMFVGAILDGLEQIVRRVSYLN